MSGDWRYEKCWGPIQQDANGIIFVLDPASPAGEDQLTQFQRNFMQGTGLNSSQTFLYVNNHRANAQGSSLQSNVPRSFQDVDKQIGTAEDSSFVFGGFERFYARCLREMKDQQRNEES